MPLLFNGRIYEGQPLDVLSADGSSTLAPGTAHLDAGTLQGVLTPQNYAVMQDGTSNRDVLDFGSGGGQVAVVDRVSGNAGDVQLANATTKIAINAGPAQVTGGGKTVGVTLAVDQGNWQPFPLVTGTDAIVQDGDAIAIQTVGGAGVQGTTDVASNSLDAAVLPANTGLVQDGAGLQVSVTGTYTDTITPQVDANGNITGFVLS